MPPLGSSRRINASVPIALAVGLAVLFAYDYARRAPGRAIDTWAYLAHARALVGSDPSPLDTLATTPKPLGTVLGTLSLPFPSEWGFGLFTTAAAVALIVGAFLAGWRWGGALGAAVAPLACAWVVDLPSAINAAQVDLVTPALLVWAVLTRGYVRVALVVVAGLLHPFVWPVAAYAGWQAAAERTRGRRIAIALGCLALAPAIWLVTDLIFWGNAFATPEWMLDHRAENLGSGGPESQSLSEQFENLRRIFVPTWQIAVVTIAGFAGLVLGPRDADEHADRFPLVAAAVWLALLTLYVVLGSTMQERYLWAVAALLAVGVAGLAGRAWMHGSTRGAAIAAAVVGTAVASVTLTSDLSDPRVYAAARRERILAMEEVFRDGLECGDVGFVGDRLTSGLIGEVAVTLDAPVHRFDLIRAAGSAGDQIHPGDDVLLVRRSPLGRLPWQPSFHTPLGRAAYAPGCGIGEVEGIRL